MELNSKNGREVVEMKKIWVRIGRRYSLTDEQYKKLCTAILDENQSVATEILKGINNYEDDDCYIVGGLDDDFVDNPNNGDFNLDVL